MSSQTEQTQCMRRRAAKALEEGVVLHIVISGGWEAVKCKDGRARADGKLGLRIRSPKRELTLFAFGIPASLGTKGQSFQLWHPQTGPRKELGHHQWA